MAFNALKYVQVLRKVGVPQKQAEEQAKGLQLVQEDLQSDLATRHDIELVKKDIKNLDYKMESLNRDVKKDINNLKKDINDLKEVTIKDINDLKEATKKDMGILRRDIIIALGGLLVTGLVCVVALARLGLLTPSR